MREVELKLLVERACADRLANCKATGAEEGAPERQVLHTIYLDTEDGALRAAGLAFRLRSAKGRWVQTVKARAGMVAGLAEAIECTIPRPGPEADPLLVTDARLRARLEEALAGRVPHPVCETEMDRVTRRLPVGHHGEVEIAIDRGEVRAGDRAETLSEVEIELVDGSPAAIFGAARQLFPQGGPVTSVLNKAERGALLAEEGLIDPPPRPHNAETVHLTPDMTSEQAAHAVLAECLQQITINIRCVLGSDDLEGPHQLRVGLRRLRSACLVFRSTLGAAVLDPLEEEARWLGHEVGTLRDLDVALDDMLGPVMSEDGADPGFASLAKAIAAHAEERRQAVRTVLAGPRVWAMQLAIGEALATRSWLDPSDWAQTARLARPIGETATEALAARLAKTSAKAKGIAGLTIDARHDLRKSLKKLRYAAEFFGPLWPEKKVRPFLKSLKRLQEMFGALNDFSMVEALFRDPTGPAGSQIDAARAAGYLTGVYAERSQAAWVDARASWKRFREADPFWQ